jgi:hypothetical protein
VRGGPAEGAGGAGGGGRRQADRRPARLSPALRGPPAWRTVRRRNRCGEEQTTPVVPYR